MPGPEALLARRRLFIFDLDGTLADTSPIHAAAFSTAFGEAVDYASIAGLTTDAAMRVLLARAGREADDETVAALVAAKRAAARAGLADVREVAGAGAFVARAAARHRLALCTSGARATVEGTLARLALPGTFAAVIAAEDVTRAKPAPDGFLAALDRTGTAAADALVFEDSEAGLAAARSAGIDAIRIGPGGYDWPTLSAALAGVCA
jgi:sugar-phosphatase